MKRLGKKGINTSLLYSGYEERRLIFGTEGKGHEVLKEFAAYLESHGGKRENIKEVCCDMSPAFIKGIEENFPNASQTFDKFCEVMGGRRGPPSA